MNGNSPRNEDDNVIRISDVYEGLMEAARSPLNDAFLQLSGRTIIDVILIVIPVLLTWIATDVIRATGVMTTTHTGLVAFIILAFVAFWTAAFKVQRADHATDCQDKFNTPPQPRND
jgi:hypothetical protein